MRQAAKKGRLWLADALSAHPLVDLVLPVAASIACYLYLEAGTYPEDGRRAFYSALAGIAGLVMTAAIFVCTMTYQSANLLMNEVRRRFQKELKRNWTSIIGWSLGAALLALGAILIDAHSVQYALTVCAFALSILLAKFLRALFWLRYTLFASEIADQQPTPIRVSQPHRALADR